MIRLENVSMRYPVPKRYRDYMLRPFATKYFTALNGVSLAIEAGESVAIMGENGAGKTTMLRIIGGLLYPSGGKAKVRGYDTLICSREARKTVGYVLNEERSFYWRLTGKQNLEFFGALDNLRRRELRIRIHEVMELVGLLNAKDVRVGSYSCGMRQRLAIARGLLSNPDVLILDEPTKSLDLVSAESMRRLVFERLGRDHRKTIILATHNVTEAENVCGRVVIMSKGKLAGSRALGDAAETAESLSEYYMRVVEHGGDS